MAQSTRGAGADGARGRRDASPLAAAGAAAPERGAKQKGERRHVFRFGLLAAPLLVASASKAAAQCFPPTNSNEALLLAHYEVPLNYSSLDMPTVLAPWHVALVGELTGVPAPSASISHTSYCYPAKQEGHLAPVLPRLRVELGLPAGFAIDASYLPPVTIDQATPDLGGLALSYAHNLIASDNGPTLTIGGRAYGTFGRVVGPVTCPSNLLQQTDPASPCYGTKPSADAFYPNAAGVDATIGAATHSGFGAFFGLGYNWLDPHFRVGFNYLNGGYDNTLVEVSLRRISVFGGISVPIVSGLSAAAEAYSVPVDLATWRLSLRYVIP